MYFIYQLQSEGRDRSLSVEDSLPRNWRPSALCPNSVRRSYFKQRIQGQAIRTECLPEGPILLGFLINRSGRYRGFGTDQEN
jgi:hypothetical protein